MAPQSRGSLMPIPGGLQSKSTPNLPTLRSLNIASAEKQAPTSAIDARHPLSPTILTSPSEPASIEDNLLEDKLSSSLSSGSASGSDSNDQGPRRPLYHHSSRSHSHLPPPTTGLYPPFYNRPPTPLPPSPSLTSLFRPSFSTTTSRPTTPDSSDADLPSGSGRETGTNTPTSSTAFAVAKSALTQRTIPRASPKVPTYEYYGFALYLASSVAFLMYVLWAYLPSPFLHQLGIYYYPNRWWALAIPAWLVVLVVWIYVALASYNLGHLTLRMGDSECLVDEAAYIAVVDRKGRIIRKDRRRLWGGAEGKGGSARTGSTRRIGGHGHARHGHFRHDSSGGKAGLGVDGEGCDWKQLWSEGTDAVMDIPVGGVCEILYGDGREREDWEFEEQGGVEREDAKNPRVAREDVMKRDTQSGWIIHQPLVANGNGKRL